MIRFTFLLPALGLGLASAVAACDNHLSYGCDERDAAWIQLYYPTAGEREPTCEEICDRRYDTDQVLACERLPDDDATTPDASAQDGSAQDGSSPDASAQDGSSPDASTDAASTDAASTDAASTDAASTDAATRVDGGRRPTRATRFYYCEVSGARGQCHKR